MKTEKITLLIEEQKKITQASSQKIQRTRNINHNFFRARCIQLITTFLSLITLTLQQCAVTEIKAQGNIRIRKKAANNTLLTVDHWVVHRVLSLTSKQVIYEVDLKPFFSQTGTSETYIKGGYFISDTEIHMSTDNDFYKFDITTETMTKHTFQPGIGKGMRGHSFFDIRTDTYNFIGYKANTKNCIVGIENTLYGIWTPNQATHPLYSSFRKITGVQTPSLWPKARIYGVAYPNMVGYYGFTGSTFEGANLTESGGWTNITSNIAVRDNQDVIAYGLNKTDFAAAVRFRTLSLANRFIKNLDTPFIQCQFHPSTDYLVTYYIEGEVCLINYNLGASTISITNCYPVASPEFDIEFMNGKMVLFRESVIAVYNFPSVSLSHVYSPQPIFMNQIAENSQQIHIFPGFKARKFDTVTMTYSTGNLIEGNILKAYHNPHNTQEVFALMDLSKIKKIRISDSAVLATYDPINLISPSLTNIRDCYLVGFDFYKQNNQLLGALYRCYYISTGQRLTLFVELNYVANSVKYLGLTFSNEYVNQIRVGVVSSNDVIVFEGARCRYLYQISYSPSFAVSQIGGNCATQFEIRQDLQMINSQVYLGLSKFVTFSSSTISGYQAKVMTLEGFGDITNCLPEQTATDTSVTPNIPPQYICGGSSFFRGDGNSHYNWGYAVLVKSEITGTIFRGGDNEIYIQQNEGTRVKYTGNKMTCYRNDDDNDSLAFKFTCGDSNCLKCGIENGYYCRKCVSPFLAVDGTCQASCPPGYYKLNDQCHEHCPLNYFKLEGGIPSCVQDCSGHSPNVYTFGDRCSNCPSGSSPSGSKCLCPVGKIVKEDHTCVTASSGNCPSGYFWHHYEMCINSVRNSSSYSVYNGKDVYCDTGNYVDFDNGFRCIPFSECMSPRLTGSHPSYGNICVTPTQCKSTLSYFVDASNSKCLSSCPILLHVALSDCVGSCPSGTVYSPLASECIASCPSTPSQYYETPTRYCKTKAECIGPEVLYASVNDFKCLKPCSSPNTLLVPSTLECHLACPSTPSLTYHLSSNSSCETATVCRGLTTPSQHFLTDSSQVCSTSCAASLYKYEVDFSCVTADQCQALADGYTDNSTMKCISKSQCSSASKLTVESYHDCVSACPAQLYAYSLTKTCETGEDCQGLTDAYTRNDTMACISEATCTSASKIVIKPYNDCSTSCPAGTYYHLGTKTCKTQVECQALSYYTKNDTMTCISKSACDSFSYFSVESYKDCASTCPTSLYKYLTDKTCKTDDECTSLTNYYTKNDTMTCITKTACDSFSYFSVESYKDCFSSCPTGLYHHLTDKTCKTNDECTSLSDRYTKNDTMVCLSKTDCDSFSYFSVESYKDCSSACPGDRYHYLTDKTCKTDDECTSLTDYYTRNDTMACVLDTTCVSSSRFLVSTFKDCAPSCPTDYYLKTSESICLTQAECQSQNLYTKNGTSQCITELVCTSSSSYLDIGLQDCVNPCSPGTYLLSSNSSCLTQPECQTANYFTNNDTDECLASCAPPKFTDESIKDCADSCPPDLFGYSAGSQCLTQDQCIELGGDFWVTLSPKSCDEGCGLKKEENSKTCYSKCPGDLYDGNVCYSEFEIEMVDGKRTEIEEKIEINFKSASEKLDLKKEIITSVEVTNEDDGSVEVISNLSFEAQNDASGTTVKIQFESLNYNNSINIKIAFETQLVIQTTENQPYAPKNYYLTTDKIEKKFEKIVIENPEKVETNSGNENKAEEEKAENESKGLKVSVSIYSSLIKILPLIIPLTSSSPSSSLLTYLAQTFNKLIIYSLFSFKMTEKVDIFYLNIFKDLMDEISEFIVDNIKPGTVETDLEYVCKKDSWRLCHVKNTIGFLTTQTVTLILSLILLIAFGLCVIMSLCSKKLKKTIEKFKTKSFPNLWLENQLQLVIAIVFCISSPLFSSWIFIVGYSMAVVLAFGCFAATIAFGVFKVHNNSTYLKKVIEEIETDFFSSKNSAINYISINFFFDTMMALLIVFLQDFPVFQSFAWLLSQCCVAYITQKKVEFKIRFFGLRTLVIDISFILLSCIIFVATIVEEEGFFTSWSIMIISCVILFFDMVFSLIFLIFEIVEWIKKGKKSRVQNRKGKKNLDLKKGKKQINFRKKPIISRNQNSKVNMFSFRKLNKKKNKGGPRIKIMPPKIGQIEKIRKIKKDEEKNSNKNLLKSEASQNILDISHKFSSKRKIDISLKAKAKIMRRSKRSIERDLRIKRVKEAMEKKKLKNLSPGKDKRRVYRKSLRIPTIEEQLLDDGSIEKQPKYGGSERELLECEKRVFTSKLGRKKYGNLLQKKVN